MTSEVFKLKGLSEQIRNDFIRDAGIRLQERLAREAKEQEMKEAEEKARQKNYSGSEKLKPRLPLMLLLLRLRKKLKPTLKKHLVFLKKQLPKPTLIH